MVIDWERLAVVTGKGFLLMLEYFIKLAALVVTAVVLSAGGTFGVKLGTGFSSVSYGLRKLFATPSDISAIVMQLRQYNSDAANFIWEPGGYEALNSILAYLNGGIVYFQTVGQNFSNQPFATFFAGMIAFTSLYFTSRLLRFYRQKGRGSFLVKMEQKLGERIFRKPEELIRKEVGPRYVNQPESLEPATKMKKSGRPTFMSGQENKYLQDYIKLAQNGGG